MTTASALEIPSVLSTNSNGFGEGFTMPWSDEKDSAENSGAMPLRVNVSSQAAFGDQMSITAANTNFRRNVCSATAYASGIVPSS